MISIIQYCTEYCGNTILLMKCKQTMLLPFFKNVRWSLSAFHSMSMWKVNQIRFIAAMGPHVILVSLLLGRDILRRKGERWCGMLICNVISSLTGDQNFGSYGYTYKSQYAPHTWASPYTRVHLRPGLMLKHWALFGHGSRCTRVIGRLNAKGAQEICFRDCAKTWLRH